jgi:hypothetical protein
MARILQRTTYTSRTPAHIATGRLVLLAVQYAVVGGIAFFILLAIVNAVLGTPQAEPAYSPYEAP